MHTQYGEKMPLRLVDEIEFWKRQESEHTVVIATLAPDLESNYKEALQTWGEAFAQVDALAGRYIETIAHAQRGVSPAIQQQILQLIDYSLLQSQHFIHFLHVLKTQSKAPSMQNQVVRVVLDHIRRESEYFIGITEAYLSK